MSLKSDAKKFKDKLRKLDIRQREFAALVGITEDHVSRMANAHMHIMKHIWLLLDAMALMSPDVIQEKIIEARGFYRPKRKTSNGND